MNALKGKVWEERQNTWYIYDNLQPRLLEVEAAWQNFPEKVYPSLREIIIEWALKQESQKEDWWRRSSKALKSIFLDKLKAR